MQPPAAILNSKNSKGEWVWTKSEKKSETPVEPIRRDRIAPILCTIWPPINNITMEPIDAVLNKVPNVPLLIFKLAFKSGVLGASDMIDMPNRKKIALK